MATFCTYTKCLKSTCEIVILYMLVEILQLVHEISSLSDVLYKKGVPKSFSKFRGKHKKQSSGGDMSKKLFLNT